MTPIPEPGPLPRDPQWCPQVGEVFKEGWYTIRIVSKTPVKVEHARDRVVVKFIISLDDAMADFEFEASPVGNGRAFRSAVIQAIAGIGVKV